MAVVAASNRIGRLHSSVKVGQALYMEKLIVSVSIVLGFEPVFQRKAGATETLHPGRMFVCCLRSLRYANCTGRRLYV